MTKSTPKTPASQKAGAKKPVKPKAVKTKAVKTRASTPPKNMKKPVSKPVRKKTAAPTKAKTTLKASTPKTAPKKPTTSKATKDDLRKTVSNLESRMKRANTLTRKSVKALESAVMTLDARTRKDSSNDKAALTLKVNQLSAKLTDMVEKTQADVNSEIKTVLNNPTVEGLQAALVRADERMSLAEQNQAAAISKVNHHLSSIALAVDTRIEEEAKARKAAIAALQTQTQNDQDQLTGRMDTIETDTAQALSRVGDKIADLSKEMTQRSTTSELSIREKVSEIALQTQTEFEAYRAGFESRIDDIAQNTQSEETQRLEQMIASLTARLEGLEYAAASTDPVEEPVQFAVPAVPHLSVVPSPAPPVMTAHQVPDAFSPALQVAQAPAAAMSNPYLEEQYAVTPDPAPVENLESHHPVEFDPNNYAAPTQAAPYIPQAPIPSTEPLRDFTETQAAPMMPPAMAPPAGELSALPPVNTSGQAAPYADLTYADPAYAETDPTMAGVRIGGDAVSKVKLPKLTGRNLRVAALATGVAVVGLFAAKGIFGGSASDNVTPQPPAQATRDAAPRNNIAPVSIPKPDTSAAPIGDYADNRAVDIAPKSEAARTLNSAATDGDPIAQFQLGLSYLEQGRTDEGVTLIRKSANQKQPAAQYRLAKLYEIGEGVTRDAEMARRLTERAATNGNRIAMHDLALYYAEGRGGVATDLPTAAKWFEKAAERGVVDSQFNLGVLFESGQGIPKNMNDAFIWYSIAAQQGDQLAKTRVDVLKATMEQSDLVATAARIKQFSPRKIDEAANGIFRDVAWGKRPENTDGKVSQVKHVQTMLAELGYDVGGADGSVGPKTRTAIIEFERVNNLPETGRVNTALADRLELATGA